MTKDNIVFPIPNTPADSSHHLRPHNTPSRALSVPQVDILPLAQICQKEVLTNGGGKKQDQTSLAAAQSLKACSILSTPPPHREHTESAISLRLQRD